MADQSLAEKLSYIDLLMYVLPGACGVLEGLAGAALVAPTAVEKLHLFGEGGLLASIVFLLTSFVMGTALQIFAHTLPEWALRLLFWSRRWASELALFEGGPCLTSSSRRSVLAALQSLGLLDEVRTQSLVNITARRKWGWWRLNMKGEQRATAFDEAQTVFRRARSFLAEAGAGQKAVVAESFYLFFRGLFSAALLGTFGFALLASTANWKTYLGLPAAATPGARPLAVLCLLLTALFGWRVRGVGQGFVRDVYLAISVADLVKKRAGAAATAASTTT